jgi:DNA-binding beta-propeller fold protein YncE
VDLVYQRPRQRRNFIVGAAMVALFLAALFALAPRAQAAELIFWDNYSAEPQSISFANIDGSGGGALNLTGAPIDDPEGMAIDSVTGRLYVASSSGGPTEKGQILFVNLDGTGGGALSTPGVPVEEPEGIAVDPIARLVYWVNTEGNGEADGSIAWARLDGSGGGLLNTAGAALESPYKLAFDPVGGRIFWANTKPNPDTISYAFVNNSGGGNLNLTGVPTSESTYALAVDSAGGRLYWLQSSDKRVAFVNLAGGSGGELNITGATLEDAYGLAIDQAIGRVYWGNYGQEEVRTNAIAFANIAGGVGGITPVTAPLDGPQDPVILKSPSGTGLPAVTRSKKSRSSLACSPGTWAADFVGSFVYQQPRTLAYQWTRNGKAISGATGTTLTAKSAGKYRCAVTGTNQAGAATQTSKPLEVDAAKAKLSTKKKAVVKAGGTATFSVKATNQGDLKSKNARLCAKVPKKAKKVLKAPKCKSLGKLKGNGKRSAKLKFKVGESAAGTYTVKFVVKGIAGKAVKAKIQVVG